MIPPNMQIRDYRSWQDRVSDCFVTAIERSRVTHVVSLSSVGAEVSRLNVLHLRAGYFMENTLAQIGIIRETGTMVGPLRADLKVPMIATRDIGGAAADAMLKLDFNGPQTRELLGQRDLSMGELANIVGRAIARPELKYANAPNEQLRPALVQMA